MVFNATFNNVSVISWWSVLLVEETGVPVENHWPVASHWQTSSHNIQLMPALKVNIIIVHPRGVVFPDGRRAIHTLKVSSCIFCKIHC